MVKIKSLRDTRAFPVLLVVNFLLFAVKLYVGLSSNSISIYSDGINNLLDGSSAAVGLISIYVLNKSRDLSFSPRSGKTEQLLSFILSALIILTGLIFLFNSIERLMYPAPVWFTVSYFCIVAFTAVVKLLLFVFLKRQSRKNESPVIRVMSLDSLTDFFITTVTLVTLWVSQNGGYAFDAVGGIAVSVIILISGVRSFIDNLTGLIGFPEKAVRQKAEEVLAAYVTENSYIEFSFCEGKRLLFKTDASISVEEAKQLKEILKKETDYNLYFLN